MIELKNEREKVKKESSRVTTLQVDLAIANAKIGLLEGQPKKANKDLLCKCGQATKAAGELRKEKEKSESKKKAT